MQTYSDILDLRLVGVDLDKVVSRYDDIENQICLRATTATLEKLSETPYYGGQITVDGQQYLGTFEVSNAIRTYSLYIVPTEQSNSKFDTIQSPIQAAGFVSNITIRFPRKLRRQSERALLNLQQEFQTQYHYVRAQFLDEYLSLQNVLFDGLEAILSTGFFAQEKDPQCSFLTLTSTHTELYTYHLGYSQVSWVIDRLIGLPHFPLSPIYGVIALLFDESLDTFLHEGVLQDSKFTVLPFTRLIELEGLRDTLVTQNFLMGKHLCALEICRAGDFSLQINCAPRHASEVQSVVDAIRAEMGSRLQRNIARYVPGKRKFVEMYRKRKDTKPSTWQSIKDALIQVAGIAIGTAAKPGA